MRRRPNAVLWLWYAVGGRLPDVHREWVLYDATARTWALRHAARHTVMIAPLALVWWLAPAPTGLRLALGLMACLVGYFYSLSYMVESVEHRLAMHGYPAGTAKKLRAEANREEAQRALERYEARYRS
ncbi:MAG: DUF5313 family protein [Haloechinothrix sp.]